MSRRKKVNREPNTECIALVAVRCPLTQVEWKEKNQEKVIREYAKAHNIKIVGVERTHGFGQGDINESFEKCCSYIYKKRIDGIIVFAMDSICTSIRDKYYKAGTVHEAGGRLFSVSDKNLRLELRED